jgi:hypothetical protein
MTSAGRYRDDKSVIGVCASRSGSNRIFQIERIFQAVACRTNPEQNAGMNENPEDKKRIFYAKLLG